MLFYVNLTVPLLAAICAKDDALMRRVYPGILSKAAGDAATKEYGDAVLTVFRSSETEEERMRFLLVEQVRNKRFNS